MPITSPLPTFVAFRRDFPDASTAEGAGEWLAAACLVDQVVATPAASRADAFLELRAALDRALGSAGADDVASLSADLRDLVGRIEDARALNLALAVASRWLAMDALPAIERGRLRAMTGRIHRQMGSTEQAAAAYDEVERIARRERSPELAARARIGWAVLAELRGNYPEQRRWFTEAAAAATEAGDPYLAAISHHALVHSAFLAGEHDVAIAHAWRAIETTRDSGAAVTESLIVTAQLFVELGFVDIALRGFALALRHDPPLRLRLPALGGVATAAARLGRRHLLDRAASGIERLDADTRGFEYIRAGALLELAEALEAAGSRVRAAAARGRALDLARPRGYHELVHRAEAAAAAPAVKPARTSTPVLSPESERIVRAVDALAPADQVLAAI
ncbi:MAG TPA: hypothetical protein VEA99_18090 [Gemmatimonadaceae bacterium]|nr:hypothetical protein [Gemmatimonadaceae bacterium]